MTPIFRNISFLLYSIVVISSSCKKSNTDPIPAPPVPPPVVKDSVINTIAGTGAFGFSGDGGLATAAQFGLSSPERVAVDKAGNIYLSDAANRRIRKINTLGIISTIAGTGVSGYSGDGGPATDAKIGFLEGLTVDDAGNVYITCDSRIRMINAAGIITTVAGGGTSTTNDGNDGPALNARLHLVTDVCLDKAGNLYIADYANHQVKKVTKSTGIISAVAGSGMQGFTGDGGAATTANLSYPEAVAVDSLGSIFIATSSRIRKVTNGIITTIAGTGDGGFNAYAGAATAVNISPYGIAFNNKGELIIADYAHSLVRKMDATGYLSTITGYGGYNKLIDGGRPYLAGFTYPSGVAADASGNIYIADYGAQRVRKITIK